MSKAAGRSLAWCGCCTAPTGRVTGQTHLGGLYSHPFEIPATQTLFSHRAHAIPQRADSNVHSGTKGALFGHTGSTGHQTDPAPPGPHSATLQHGTAMAQRAALASRPDSGQLTGARSRPRQAARWVQNGTGQGLERSSQQGLARLGYSEPEGGAAKPG